MPETFTINSLLVSKIIPIGRTRLNYLIRNGAKFQDGTLEEGKPYLIGWKSGDGKKSSWCIDREEIENWKQRAKKNNLS